MSQRGGSSGRYVEWAHSSDSSSSDDSNATRANTVMITNLDSKTTSAALMRQLMIAGPFGRVYSVNIKITETNGERGATALLAFFKKESCHFLKTYVNDLGIRVMGRPIKVSDTKEKAPENIEPQGRDDSRVLLFEGKNELLTPDKLTSLFAKHKIRESHIQRKELVWKTATKSKVGVIFTSYSDAYRMIGVVHRNYELDDLRAFYGRDPMECGVSKYANPDDEEEVKFKINW
ncbi:hypothetical protein V8F20_003427 [Naviculisporaceae sp. PSN 640]